jgi:hypothetical protein
MSYSRTVNGSPKKYSTMALRRQNAIKVTWRTIYRAAAGLQPADSRRQRRRAQAHCGTLKARARSGDLIHEHDFQQSGRASILALLAS